MAATLPGRSLVIPLPSHMHFLLSRLRALRAGHADALLTLRSSLHSMDDCPACCYALHLM